MPCLWSTHEGRRPMLCMLSYIQASLQAEVSGVGMADGAVLVREESSEVDHRRVMLDCARHLHGTLRCWELHSILLLWPGHGADGPAELDMTNALRHASYYMLDKPQVDVVDWVSKSVADINSSCCRSKMRGTSSSGASSASLRRSRSHTRSV